MNWSASGTSHFTGEGKMSKKLDGKVAIVTGASKGIGAGSEALGR
jgi:hypothetical protein